MWDSGDGLWDGDGVYCLHAIHVVVAVRVLSCLVVLSCVLRNGGGVLWCVVSLLVFSVFSVFSFLFCRGVRGSARAALRARTLSPNTVVFSFPIACSFSSFFSSFFLLSFASSLFLPLFFCVFGMAVGVHHVSVCSVGMTAIGSLFRSSSFFW